MSSTKVTTLFKVTVSGETITKLSQLICSLMYPIITFSQRDRSLTYRKILESVADIDPQL